jgi:hypothetical protein
MAASGLDSIAFAAHHRIIPLPRPLTPGKAKGVTVSDAPGAHKRTGPIRRGHQAERVGFEPTEPCGSRALQARAFGQTTLPLRNANRHHVPIGTPLL